MYKQIKRFIGLVIMRTSRFLFFALICLFLSACTAPKLQLFQDGSVPLQEFTLRGKEQGKVLVVPVRGVISDAPDKGLLYSKPSMVQEVVSQIRLAEQDEEIRAIVLKVDSPGGSISASDILYHEITALKKRTGIKVVVAMMGVAASGGYYISLPADLILAHPTTVTGSIGVIFMGPKVKGLMDKIGVDMEVTKSGVNKDMGSPFRDSTDKEKAILEEIIDELAERFSNLVVEHRKLNKSQLKEVFSARVFLAKDALQQGLIDRIGYLDDALMEAQKLAGLPRDAKVIVYRRTEYPDDNLYNTFTNQSVAGRVSLVDLGLENSVTVLGPGFYYLWLPATGYY
jgi:protease-4